MEKKRKRYLYHDQGEGACGHPAFIYTDEYGPYPNHAIVRSHLRTLTGGELYKYSGMICGSCGQSVLKVNVSSVR